MNIAMRNGLPNHERRALAALLMQHVVVAADGNASTLRYAGVKVHRRGTPLDAKSFCPLRNRIVLGWPETPWDDLGSFPLDHFLHL
jgi:hypothetical protein